MLLVSIFSNPNTQLVGLLGFVAKPRQGIVGRMLDDQGYRSR